MLNENPPNHEPPTIEAWHKGWRCASGRKLAADEAVSCAGGRQACQRQVRWRGSVVEDAATWHSAHWRASVAVSVTPPPRATAIRHVKKRGQNERQWGGGQKCRSRGREWHGG